MPIKWLQDIKCSWLARAQQQVTEGANRLGLDIVLVSNGVSTRAIDKKPAPDCKVFRCTSIWLFPEHTYTEHIDTTTIYYWIGDTWNNVKTCKHICHKQPTCLLNNALVIKTCRVASKSVLLSVICWYKPPCWSSSGGIVAAAGVLSRAHTVPQNQRDVFKSELEWLVKIRVLEEGSRSEWIAGTLIIGKKLLPREETPHAWWISNFHGLI